MQARLFNVAFISAILVFLGVVALSACDPPNFTWPETIPDVKPVKAQGPSAFDRWKARRLAASSPSLVAGAAMVDLTPANPHGTYIAGYMPNKKAAGVGMPITGRVLLLDDGRNTLVLVNLDFVGLMNDRIWDMRGRVSKTYGKDILIASTHTHAGPDTLGMWGSWAFFALPVESGIDERYMDRVERDVAAAIVQAALNARPAELFANEVTIPPGISENAHVPGLKDDALTVLQARDREGRSIGTLVNYACHAEFLGQNNDELHPDFPGYLYREVEQREGGIALFMNGALGVIVVPAMPRHTENNVRLRRDAAIRAGAVLASYTGRALDNAVRLDLDQIRIDRRLVKFPVENDVFTYLGQKGIFTRSMKNNMLYSEVWRVDLGALTLASVPGEISPTLGFRIKDRMPGRYKMLLGLANDEIGYIMSAEEWQNPLYAYERTVSVGPQTGR